MKRLIFYRIEQSGTLGFYQRKLRIGLGAGWATACREFSQKFQKTKIRDLEGVI